MISQVALVQTYLRRVKIEPVITQPIILDHRPGHVQTGVDLPLHAVKIPGLVEADLNILFVNPARVAVKSRPGQLGEILERLARQANRETIDSDKVSFLFIGRPVKLPCKLEI